MNIISVSTAGRGQQANPATELWRRMAVAILAACVFAATLVVSPVGAQQQNEIILSVDFDGTGPFADPLDDGSGNGVHTPGEDGGPNNNVVRTNDQVQYRIDWNVNEVDGTAVTIAMTLPDGMTWLDDPSTTTGIPAGCASGSNTGLGGRELICITDVENEGSNGAIHPRAFVGAFLDGDSLAPTASIDTGESAPVTSNAVPITVSARPKGDWQKGEAVVDSVSGDLIGYEPNEIFYGIDNGGESGRIFLWNVRLIPAGGLKGAEPMNDALPIQFFDHMWFTADQAVLATGLVPGGRTACGGYDGDGAYPYGTTGLGTAADTTAGAWTCTDLTASSGSAYPLIQVDINGQDTQNPPTNNADGSGNSDTLISGQVAFWISEEDIDAMPTPRIVANAIAGNDTPIDNLGDVEPIQINGTNGPVDEANFGLTNNSAYEFPTGPQGGNPGRSFRHWIRYQNGPYAEIQVTDPNTGLEYLGFDSRTTSFGGTGYTITDGANGVNGDVFNAQRWDGDGQVPRGNEMILRTDFTTQTSRSVGADFSRAVHGCVAFDNTHQELIPFPATHPVSIIDPHPTIPSLVMNRATIGGSVGAGSPESGDLARVITGNGTVTTSYHWLSYPNGVVQNRGDVPYVVEFASAQTPVGNAFGEHEVTCNGDDADTRGWVDATDAAGLAFFDPNGDGRFEDIDLVRVRTLEPVLWEGPSARGVTSWGWGMQINLNIRVKDNPAAGFQEANQELFAYASRASGDWDGAGAPPNNTCTFNAAFTADSATNGWCNLPFADDGANSTDVTDFNNDYDSSAVEFLDSAGRIRSAHADAVYIVEPALAVAKRNLAGAADINVNGDIIEFEVNPRVVGSSLDTIANVRLTDALNANYEFVAFTQLPSTPGATCSYTSAINCSFGTHPGGWSDTVRYTVRVVEAGANATLRNTATVSGVDPILGLPKTPASSSAFSFTAGPFEESAIVKVLDSHIGPCLTHPTEDPAPADWGTDCEYIAQNSGLSFELIASNEGNIELDNYRLIDVLPFNGDGGEPASATLTGDGRTPPSSFTGTVEFAAVSGPAGATYLYSADVPGTISRDPAVSEGANTWCTAPSGGTVVFGSGACPTGPATVTAIYADLGTIDVGATEVVTLGLQTVGNTCDDYYTNTFGGRTDDLRLPIRSNDVTLMVGFCDPGIDIEKDTNGFDADTPTGPAIALGDTVTWTYVVENTGGTAIFDAVVTDDQGVNVSCDVDGDGTFDGTNVIPFLAHGASVTCEGTAPADTLGQYSNNATVVGTGAVPDPATCGCDVSDPSTWPTDADGYVVPTNSVTGDPDFPLDAEDPSHYFGYEATPAVDIEKDTNGVQADTPSGPNLNPGDPITWTYVVENTGTLPLSPATVTDSEGVVVTCEASLGDAGGDNIIDILLPGESVTCTGTGTATAGQYSNTATVTGPALTPPDGCACDPTDPATWPTDPAVYEPMLDDAGEPVVVDDEDDSHYFGADPSVDIEKDTNGDQADTPNGPVIAIGDTVTWTYVVENTGNTALAPATVTDDQGVTVLCDVDGDGTFEGSNVIPVLLPGETVTCEGTGIATGGQYSNNAEVTGTPALPDPATCGCDLDDPSTWPEAAGDYSTALGEDGEPLGDVADDDDSHYFGAAPAIDIEKDTNGVQADTPVGPFIEVNGAVTWTYVVANTGNTSLANAEVTDDQGVTVDCDVDGDGTFDGTNVIPFLAPGDSVTCQGTGTASAGQYTNNASVSGDPVMPDPDTCGCDLDDPATWPEDPAAFGPLLGEDGEPVDPVEDDDDSHYFGVAPAIDIEKSTNGVDADEVTGPQVPVGDPVTWTYVVVNTGNTALAPATVTDDQGVVVDCDVDGDGVFDGTNAIPFLAPGDSVTCQGTGISTGGQYTNNGSVSGDPVLPDPDTCGCDLDDPSTWPEDPAAYEAPVGPNGETFDPVADDDDSNFFGTEASIDIEKSTNGVDADTVTGPQVPVGEPVTWTYVVVNDGNTPLADATVTDSQGVTVSCDVDGDGTFDGTNVISLMQPGDSVSCEGTGISTGGQYTNTADVTGDPVLPDPDTCGCDLFDPSTWPEDPALYTDIVDEDGNPVDPVVDADDSHYFGTDSSIDIEKSTNGVDADTVLGPEIAVGDPITWTYVVVNDGNTVLGGVTVTDSQGVVVDCDVDGDGVFDGTNVIGLMQPGDTVTCEGTGEATSGQYTNVGDVTGDPLLPNPDTCGCDLFDPSTWPEDPALYSDVVDEDGNPVDPVTDEDASHYFGTGPGIDIEKSTNGVDADTVTGPQIAVGDTVTWTYEVTNVGNTVMANSVVTDDQGVTVSCDVDGDGVFDGTNVIPLIQPGDSVTCEGTGISTGGQYTNNSSVVGDSVVPDPDTCGCDLFDPSTWPDDPAGYMPQVDEDGNPVGPLGDEDPSHYFGFDAGVDIEKSTNGADADVAPGPALAPGEPVTWTYVVTNTGNVPLLDAVVSDNQGVVVNCDVDGDGALDGTNMIPFLAAGASVTCEGAGVAEPGPYSNEGSVSGVPALPDPDTCGCDLFDPSTWPTDPALYTPVVDGDGNPVAPASDSDLSHLIGNGPGIDIEKSTNGADSDTAPGEEIASGAPVTWTYVVTNTGNVPLANAEVVDDQGVVVSCDVDGDGTFDGTAAIPLLLAGESVTCEGTGIATAGLYTNNATVGGDPVLPNPSTCGCDLNDPATWPTDVSLYTPLLGLDGQPVASVDDADPSNYTGVLAAIAGTLWHDEDEDGVLEAGEETFAGILVSLLDADGNPVLDENGNPITTVTDSLGNYFFDVEPGDYRLQFTAPDGFRSSLGTGGDNDADPNTLVTGVFSVGPGELVPDIDAGFVTEEAPSSLAFTGAESRALLLLAMMLLATGIAMATFIGAASRRRKETA